MLNDIEEFKSVLQRGTRILSKILVGCAAEHLPFLDTNRDSYFILETVTKDTNHWLVSPWCVAIKKSQRRSCPKSDLPWVTSQEQPQSLLDSIMMRSRLLLASDSWELRLGTASSLGFLITTHQGLTNQWLISLVTVSGMEYEFLSVFKNRKCLTAHPKRIFERIGVPLILLR